MVLPRRAARAVVTAPHPIPLAERAYRVRRISTTFGRIYFGIKSNQFISRRIAPPDMDQRWSTLHRNSAERVYDLAIDLRGMVLKACQFMSARPDVLPPEYTDCLARLQDRVPSHPLERLREEVEQAVGGGLDEIFEWIGPEPVAAASLAQVHDARLLDGTRVAVKIQYPEIEALVLHDLANLQLLIRAVGLVERDLDWMPLFRELRRTMPRELDFEHEAESLTTIGGYFEGADDVRVPRVYPELSSKRVLVMEYIEGIKIDDVVALKAAGIEPDAVMQRLVEAYCEQLLSHGFFHADPHPGNLIVEPLGDASVSGPRPFRIVFIDFGLTKQLPTGFREASARFAAALLSGDPRAMAEALGQMGFETQQGGIDAIEDITKIILRTAALMRDQAFVDRDLVREAAADLPRLIRENPIVRVPGHIVLVGRVIGLLAGLGHALEARVDMVSVILPYLMGVRPVGDTPSGGPGTRS